MTSNLATSAIMDAGMECLREKLGIIEAEMFIATIKAEDFNYTKWRQTQPWIDMPLEQLLDEVSVNFPQESFISPFPLPQD
jgi:hypothetical protein